MKKEAVDKHTKNQNSMEDKKSSSFDLLRGSGTFNDEAYWFRLTVIVIEALFLIALAWILKEWAIGPVAAKYFSGISFAGIFKAGKGRSP